jgi:acetylornithine/N-succinyldiaminopimelate aminotransferase
MSTLRSSFFRHLAQTSPAPLGFEVDYGKGSWLYSSAGRKYLDLISGISVCNIGHAHPHVVNAIQEQAGRYMHTMVYGEHIQSPQVKYAEALCASLPKALNSVYFTNSGAEAVEGAMKLAKRVTGRTGFVSFKNAYHGSTQGALSLMGDEFFKNAYRPLLPGMIKLEFNDNEALHLITAETAAVFIEPVQGEAGVIPAVPDFLKALRLRCTQTGTLLVFDEIQSGFGRSGSLFVFEQYGVIPDILLSAKALGGGMPLGAFIAGSNLMKTLSENPVLGHITTFGGHPVSCAAGLAALEVLEKENLLHLVKEKEILFSSMLKDSGIGLYRSSGLLIAVEFDSAAENQRVIANCFERGVITDWFLFNDKALRIAPPLTITEAEIRFACEVVVESARTR